eukprot:9477424-Pyramimonas_sp.AAC.1
MGSIIAHLQHRQGSSSSGATASAVPSPSSVPAAQPNPPAPIGGSAIPMGPSGEKMTLAPAVAARGPCVAQ